MNRCIVAIFALSMCACQTNLYVPRTDAEGNARAVKVVSVAGDAANLDAGYRGPGGEEVWVRSDAIVHSEATRAAGDVVTATSRGVGNILWNYFFGSSVLETARGATQIGLSEQETARHGATQETTRQTEREITRRLAE